MAELVLHLPYLAHLPITLAVVAVVHIKVAQQELVVTVAVLMDQQLIQLLRQQLLILAVAVVVVAHLSQLLLVQEVTVAQA
jgi:hypothetical protein